MMLYHWRENLCDSPDEEFHNIQNKLTTYFSVKMNMQHLK